MDRPDTDRIISLTGGFWDPSWRSANGKVKRGFVRGLGSQLCACMQSNASRQILTNPPGNIYVFSGLNYKVVKAVPAKRSGGEGSTKLRPDLHFASLKPELTRLLLCNKKERHSGIIQAALFASVSPYFNYYSRVEHPPKPVNHGFPSKLHLSTAGLPKHALFSKLHRQQPATNNNEGYLMTNANNDSRDFAQLIDAVRVFLTVTQQFHRSKHLRDRKTLSELERQVAANSPPINQDVLEAVCQAAVRNDLARLIPSFLRVAWKLGIDMQTEFYERLCETLIEDRRWHEIKRVLEGLITQNTQHMSTKLLNTELRLYLHFERYSLLKFDRVMRLFNQQGCEMDQASYHLLIEAAIANRNMRDSRDVTSRMLKAGFAVNEDTYKAFLSRMVAIGPNRVLEEDVVAALQKANLELNVGILNSLIRLRSIVGDDRSLQQYVEQLKQRPTTSTPSTSNMQGEKDMGSTTGTPSTAVLGALPDIKTIPILIEHFGRRRRLDSAIRVFSLLEALQLKPSPEIVAYMLLTYARCDQTQRGLSFFSELLQNLPERTKRPAEKLVKSLGWDGIYSRNGIRDVSINVFILNALLSVVVPIKGLDAISTVLQLMELLHVQPDDETARQILYFLDKYEGVGSNTLITILYQLSQYQHIQGRMRHLNILLHSILREYKEQWKGRGGWLADAARLSLSASHTAIPDVTTSRTADRTTRYFSSFYRESKIAIPLRSDLHQILNFVKSSGSRRDAATYSILMFYHSRVKKNPKAVEHLYEEMLSNEILPNAYHVAALIEVNCLTGKLATARNLLDHAALDGIKVNQVLYSMLIRAYGDHAKPDEGLNVYRQMLKARIKPDVAALEGVIRG
ncbi:3_t:CDS:2, partial [Acaulospora colombiana]